MPGLDDTQHRKAKLRLVRKAQRQRSAALKDGRARMTFHRNRDVTLKFRFRWTQVTSKSYIRNLARFRRVEQKRQDATAGLWDSWRNPEGEIVRSRTIMTTSANELLSVHDRMPAILPRKVEDFWLDDDVQDAGASCSVLAPCPAAAMETYGVFSLINPPSNDGPKVVRLLGKETPRGRKCQDEPMLFWRLLAWLVGTGPDSCLF